MKAIVSDIEILKSLEPCCVSSYLKSKGWHERTRVPDEVSGWTRDTFSDDKLKIYLPLDPSFDDYPRRMYEVMEVLEKAENRSQLDILSELITIVHNVTVQGVVMQIDTPKKEHLNGEVTLVGVVVDKLRKIKTELKKHDYILAIKAYQERLIITCQGDLIKESNAFILKNPSNIILENIE